MLIGLLALSQVMAGSPAVLAQDLGLAQSAELAGDWLNAQYQPSRGNSGLRYAQTSLDVEPPLIEHDVIDEAEADIRQSFVATVVDDEELESVLLYYRYAGETSFSRHVMTQVSSSSTYIAQIPTDPNSYTAFEYYIQARDTSGNRTVRGYSFSPLVRQIVPSASTLPDTATTAVPAAGTAESGVGRKLPRVAYIVGGVLLLGLIASAAGGGSGGGGAQECGTAGCRLTLTVNQPY
jgi:hypothetical protein